MGSGGDKVQNSEKKDIVESELVLKHFDTELITFKYIDEGIKGQRIEIVHQNKEAKKMFPIGLDVSSKGIMSWLKQRVIPKNREYVDALLSKMGLNHSDTCCAIIKL